MRFDFRYLGSPLHGDKRPVVPVTLAQIGPVAGLVDSGASGIRVGTWLAEAAGLDLSEGVQDGGILIGGGRYAGVTLTLPIQVGKWPPWEAEVTFLQGWNHEHLVLGVKGFMDHFTVRIEAQQRALYLTRR